MERDLKKKRRTGSGEKAGTETAERRLYQMEYSSPIGALTLISDSKALLSLEFEQKRYPFSLPERCQLTVLPDYSGNREGGGGQGSCQDGAGSGRSQVFPAPLLQAARWLDCYFSGRSPDFLPPLKPEGSPFRRRVWEELLRIPYGTTVTYGSIAKKLAEEEGRPHMSAQAVGGAVGHNPIGIIIPCHRVVGADGSLTGFGGGIKTKKALLELERAEY